tara:strand:- start:2344 stop:2694 length:351 start_codon:yes stop_codon:yes gene_type:complete
MGVSYNTIIDQGADWYFTVIYDNPDGQPIDITGSTAALQLRSLPSSPIYVLSLATDGDGITIDGGAGTVNIHATAEQTGAIDEGTYFYDLEITAPATTVVTRLVQGQIVVSAQVTK